MNNFNITEFLRWSPKGLKLFSPLFGEVTFKSIDDCDLIAVRDKHEVIRWFYREGSYIPNGEGGYEESECMLFPSCDCRTWIHWQNTLFLESIGSVCVDTITGNKFLLGNDGTYFSDNTGCCYYYLIESDEGNYMLNSRYATPEEVREFFEELDKNGYKWDGKMVVKKEQNKPKFKVGDIIRNEPIGVFLTIKEVKDDCYYTTDGTTLRFKYQDRWELVGSVERLDKKEVPPHKFKVGDIVKFDRPSATIQREILDIDFDKERYVTRRIDDCGALKEYIYFCEQDDYVLVAIPAKLSLEDRIAALEDKVKVLTNRIDAIAQVIIKHSYVYQSPDRAGDCVTLEDMK